MIDIILASPTGFLLGLGIGFALAFWVVRHFAY